MRRFFIIWATFLVSGLGANQDYERYFDFGSGPVELISSESYLDSDGSAQRIFQDVTLSSPAGPIRLTLSRPPVLPEGGLPCVFIIAGLETGRKSLRLIPDHGDFILVSYEYPPMIKRARTKMGLFYIPEIKHACFTVPAQVNFALDYLKTQEAISRTPISMIGISFGSAFLPVALHFGQKEGRTYGPIVFGYGGAGLSCLFGSVMPGPLWFRRIAASMATHIFYPLEASLHLPYVHGDFLLVNGTRDRVVPLPCAVRLQELVPQPKQIINLDRDHLQPGNRELIVELLTISRRWLESEIKKTES